LSLSLFIARRIYRESDGGKQVSRPAVLIAMAGIAIGLAVMIIAVAVVIGFKSEVRNKDISYANQRLRLILNTYYLILISYSVLPGYTSNAFLIDGLNRIPGVYSPIPMGAFYTVAKLPVDDSVSLCSW